MGKLLYLKYTNIWPGSNICRKLSIVTPSISKAVDFSNSYFLIVYNHIFAFIYVRIYCMIYLHMSMRNSLNFNLNILVRLFMRKFKNFRELLYYIIISRPVFNLLLSHHSKRILNDLCFYSVFTIFKFSLIFVSIFNILSFYTGLRVF